MRQKVSTKSLKRKPCLMVKCQKLSLWDKEQEKNIHYHHFTEQLWLDVTASTIRQEKETKTLRIRKEEITFSV